MPETAKKQKRKKGVYLGHSKRRKDDYHDPILIYRKQYL